MQQPGRHFNPISVWRIIIIKETQHGIAQQIKLLRNICCAQLTCSSNSIHPPTTYEFVCVLQRRIWQRMDMFVSIFRDVALGLCIFLVLSSKVCNFQLASVCHLQTFRSFRYVQTKLAKQEQILFSFVCMSISVATEKRAAASVWLKLHEIFCTPPFCLRIKQTLRRCLIWLTNFLWRTRRVFSLSLSISRWLSCRIEQGRN